MDGRRELAHIRKNYRRYHRVVGETITWYSFIPFSDDGSRYDDVYDEGGTGSNGKKYKNKVIVPVMLITETEDTKRAIPEGRQPVQVVNVVMSIADMRDAGIDEPYEYQRHLNDLFVYDARYFSVTMYRVRGRVKDDVLVVVEGIEIYLNDEMPNDPGPESLGVTDFPWPAALPVAT